jgi:dienelactone hydrolase
VDKNVLPFLGLDDMKSADRFILFLTVALVLAGCANVGNVRFRVGERNHQALLCVPKKTKPPYPAVIFNHGMVVDLHGLSGAIDRGYSLDTFCQALAGDGFLAFLPVRNGLEALSTQLAIVLGAYSHVGGMKNVDPGRIAVAGFSRGALLTLIAARHGLGAKAFVLMATAPGPKSELAAAGEDVSRVRAPVQILVARGDDRFIVNGSQRLAAAFRKAGKPVDFHEYPGGPLNCKPGPGPPCAHKLFYTLGAYWSDVNDFLQKTLR